MPTPLHPISADARSALADRYAEHNLPHLAEWIRSGQADNSTLTPCLEALTDMQTRLRLTVRATAGVPGTRRARRPLELMFSEPGE